MLVIAIAAGFVALPLVAVLGSAILWGLLPFLILAVWGLWLGLRRSYRDGHLIEILEITSDRLKLIRRDPDGHERTFEANPFWVTVTLHPEAGPVEDYLTLRGSDREVELGSFLAPEERRRLAGELKARLRGLGQAS